MNMDLSFNLTQEQKLVMTQQMQLSLKVLQMSSVELVEYMEKELQENPVLEADVSAPEKTEEFEENINYKELIKHLEFDNYSHGTTERDETDEVSPLNFISEEKDLNSYLKEQLLDLALTEEISNLSEYIIDNLDNRGFLDMSKELISEETGIQINIVEKALYIVKSLEPAELD